MNAIPYKPTPDGAARFNAAANRRVRKKDPPTPHDKGPDIQQRPIFSEDGALLRPELVMKATWADPKAPSMNVTARRRRDGLAVMLEQSRITKHQAQAADRFRNDIALSGGARLEMPDLGGVRVSTPFTTFGPNDTQLDALTRVQKAWQAMGLQYAGVVSWVVVSCGTIAEYESAKRIRNGKGTEMLRIALDRLDVYYQSVKDTP